MFPLLHIFAALVIITGASVFLWIADRSLKHSIRHRTARATLLVVLLTITVLGCTWLYLIVSFFIPDFSERDAVRSGYSKIPQVKQIDELIGEADHFISGPQKNGRDEWCTDVYFSGRYEFGMREDVEVNLWTSEVTVVGPPTFYLNVVKQVDVEPDGRFLVAYDTSLSRTFGAAEWEKVVEANGDFSVIGIRLQNTAVPNFDKYVEQLPHRRFGP